MENFIDRFATPFKDLLCKETKSFNEREAILVAQLHLANSDTDDVRTALAGKEELVQNLQRSAQDDATHISTQYLQLIEAAALEETIKRQMQQLQHQVAEQQFQMKENDIEIRDLRMQRDDHAEERRKIEAALKQAEGREQQNATDIDNLRQQLTRETTAQVSNSQNLFRVLSTLFCRNLELTKARTELRAVKGERDEAADKLAIAEMTLNFADLTLGRKKHGTDTQLQGSERGREETIAKLEPVESEPERACDPSESHNEAADSEKLLAFILVFCWAEYCTVLLLVHRQALTYCQ